MKSFRTIAMILATSLTATIMAPVLAHADNAGNAFPNPVVNWPPFTHNNHVGDNFPAPVASGLTRADVKAQLVQAQASGVIPDAPSNYPPNATEINHNRMIYQAAHGCDAAQAGSAS
jgi:Domain of unknown function (DUF4148)